MINELNYLQQYVFHRLHQGYCYFCEVAVEEAKHYRKQGNIPGDDDEKHGKPKRLATSAHHYMGQVVELPFFIYPFVQGFKKARLMGEDYYYID